MMRARLRERASRGSHPSRRSQPEIRDIRRTVLFEGRFTIRGQLRWLRIESRPRSASTAIAMEWNVVDITDLKFAHEALRESESVSRAGGNEPRIHIGEFEGPLRLCESAAVRLLHAKDAGEIIGFHL